jgi:hypothetical protein
LRQVRADEKRSIIGSTDAMKKYAKELKRKVRKARQLERKKRIEDRKKEAIESV